MTAAVRGGTAQDTLAFLASYRPGLAEAVTARVPADSLQALTGAGRVGWIPAEHDVNFVNAIVEEMGHAGAVAMIRESVGQHFDGPLLRNTVGFAKRMFGLTPVGLMKMVPRSWPVVYRGFGKPGFISTAKNMAGFSLSDALPIALTAPGYLASWEGIFSGIIDAGVGGVAQGLEVKVLPDIVGLRLDVRTTWSQAN